LVWFFDSTAVWGLVLTRQDLYHLSHAPSPFFALGIFRIGLYIYTQASLGCDPPIYAFCLAGMTGTYHHPQPLLVEMGFLKLFA
jgi:hypothetical protein